jgi:ferredoxin--NADP+ reductase
MSYPIIFKQQLSKQVFTLRVRAPQIAAGALPGQFVILRINEEGERFPLTLADWSADEGWIFLVFQVVGKSTFTLSKLEVGDELKDVVGPLGLPSEIENYGRVICVGGGVGIAALYPIARALRRAGNRVDSIIGARNEELLILEKEMEAVSTSLTIMTVAGS